jgi:endo-1,4-beta-xylanase
MALPHPDRPLTPKKRRFPSRRETGYHHRVPSLARVYEPFFPIGAAVERRTLASHGDLLRGQVNGLVCENAMKWERIHPLEGDGEASYRFSDADAIVAFAATNGMRMRGHTLLWHQQCPAWVFEARAGADAKALVLARLRSHVGTLLARYRGTVACWDVVNEAIADDGGWRVDSGWHRSAGADADGDGIPDYLVHAFRFAREADSSARLFYNDYNIESGPKLEQALRLARSLRGRGLVDGVGIQGHWSIHAPEPCVVGDAIARFAALGVAVEITELDLSVYRWGDVSAFPCLAPELERAQAERYGALFRVFREQAAAGRLQAVTFWGIADDSTWLDDFPVPGRKNWPLLFDVAHRPKEAFRSVASW